MRCHIPFQFLFAPERGGRQGELPAAPAMRGLWRLAAPWRAQAPAA